MRSPETISASKKCSNQSQRTIVWRGLWRLIPLGSHRMTRGYRKPNVSGLNNPIRSRATLQLDIKLRIGQRERVAHQQLTIGCRRSVESVYRGLAASPSACWSKQATSPKKATCHIMSRMIKYIFVVTRGTSQIHIKLAATHGSIVGTPPKPRPKQKHTNPHPASPGPAIIHFLFWV